MNLGIIGFGNLGRALASGLVKSGHSDIGSLYVCDNSRQALDFAMGEPYNAKTDYDVNYVIRNSSIVFLTVKSNVFVELSHVIDKDALKDKTLVSFMAGMSMEAISSLIGDAMLVRAMPSLAIATCEGVIGYTKSPPEVEGIFEKLGYAFETDPENIEKVMAFSSCGLGFAAYLIDAFASAGSSMGFSPEVSAKIAALTFKNAVERGSFRETVSAVATPGGATEQGVLHMDECKTYEIVAQAVQKAYKKMS